MRATKILMASGSFAKASSVAPWGSGAIEVHGTERIRADRLPLARGFSRNGHMMARRLGGREVGLNVVTLA